MEVQMEMDGDDGKGKFEYSSKHKHFNGKRYLLYQGRWKRTSYKHTFLSHDVWNFFNPDNPIKKGEVIHHINFKPFDDDIENLEKMRLGEHSRLHNSGERNSKWKGGISSDLKKYAREYRKRNYVTKTLFSVYNGKDGFYYLDNVKYNKKNW